MAISVVNMIPYSLSGETNQDSEPNIAVDPANPSLIAASAFTLDPDPNATHAPIYVSGDGGITWSLHSIVPYCQGITGDITLRYAWATENLYVGYIQTDGLGADVAVARTADTTLSSEMELISQVQSGDQPYIQAATVPGGPDAGKDRVYVGYSDGWASMHYSIDASIADPIFKTVKLESRTFQDGIVYNLPQVRTAIHADGPIYAVFHSVRVGDQVDVVVVRDDQWGAGAAPFADLKDSDDSKPGQRVVKNAVIGNAFFGQEGGEGELSIAVDPNDATTVYVAWADEQEETGYTVHVRRSTDGGQSWPATEELWTIPLAQNPALAVNKAGTVGFLLQQFRETVAGPRWETHFRYKGTDGFEEDLMLANVPADTPVNTWGTYLGDYIHLMAVEGNFYGIFCANNTPDPGNFPHKVTYQRNHDLLTKKLLAIDGVTDVEASIDPFFVKVTGTEERASLLKRIDELAIDPLALLLPGGVYQRLVELWHPHEPTVAEIRAAADGMSVDEMAFFLARARAIGGHARAVEEALIELM